MSRLSRAASAALHARILTAYRTLPPGARLADVAAEAACSVPQVHRVLHAAGTYRRPASPRPAALLAALLATPPGTPLKAFCAQVGCTHHHAHRLLRAAA